MHLSRIWASDFEFEDVRRGTLTGRTGSTSHDDRVQLSALWCSDRVRQQARRQAGQVPHVRTEVRHPGPELRKGGESRPGPQAQGRSHPGLLPGGLPRQLEDLLQTGKRHAAGVRDCGGLLSVLPVRFVLPGVRRLLHYLGLALRLLPERHLSNRPGRGRAARDRHRHLGHLPLARPRADLHLLVHALSGRAALHHHALARQKITASPSARSGPATPRCTCSCRSSRSAASSSSPPRS